MVWTKLFSKGVQWRFKGLKHWITLWISISDNDLGRFLQMRTERKRENVTPFSMLLWNFLHLAYFVVEKYPRRCQCRRRVHWTRTWWPTAIAMRTNVVTTVTPHHHIWGHPPQKKWKKQKNVCCWQMFFSTIVLHECLHVKILHKSLLYTCKKSFTRVKIFDTCKVF